MLDSFLAILRVLAQPLNLRYLLQHVDAQIFVQFPRGLRDRQELAGYLKSWGLARNSKSWRYKILNFRLRYILKKASANTCYTEKMSDPMLGG
jgi:hypothetical protein